MDFQPLARRIEVRRVESNDLHRRGRKQPIQRRNVVQIHGAGQRDCGIHLTAQVDEVVAGRLGLVDSEAHQSTSAAILAVFMDDMV